MSSIDIIMKSIRSLLNMNEENTSLLKSMLNNIDANHIYDKFGLTTGKKQYTNDELLSKTDLLNAIMELVLENPNLEVMDVVERKKILAKLYSVIASLYEQLFEQSEDRVLENAAYLVMYSMLSYLADKQTISSLVIEEYNKKLISKESMLSSMDIMGQLEFNTYYLIVLMVSNIGNYDGLLRLNSRISQTQHLLDKAQIAELEKEEISVENGMKISAFGNVIYLTGLLKEYLFDGKISSEDNQDIYSLIDMHAYNVFHLLGSEAIELKLIGHLLKYTYEQIAQNSIWNIAEKSPKIREFIQSNLSGNGRYIYSLLPSQREVISEVLTPKKSVIVGMPTSSGKSLLAEMQILFSLHNYKTDNFSPTVCYIVPTNALIEQVKHDLAEDFKGFKFNIETVLPYYDIDEIEEEILTRKHIDILISTPEKLESLIRQGHSSIMNTRLVILDEAHNLGDLNRGSKFELVLASVKQKIKEANFLLLSPFISNAEDIGEWLADSKRNSTTVSMEWTATRQYIGCNLLKNKKCESVLNFYKSARSTDKENIEIKLRSNPMEVKEELHSDTVSDVVKLCVILSDFINQRGNVLVLCPGLGTSKKLAEKITKYFVKHKKLQDLSSNYDVQKALEIIKLENNEDDTLLECVKYGVCYHNAGLSSLVKETIEDLIRKNQIKIVFATTTLAQGMNFPINTVIFDTIKFTGQNARYLTNAEFWNIAGRAGRAYKDKEGYIILSFAKSQKETKENTLRYIRKDLEEVVSSLNAFFSSDNQIELEYNFFRNHQNTPVLNLLQYINHILNIGYEYNINPMDMAKIRTILNDSFLYHSLSKKEGFISAQLKLNNFVTQYVRHTSQKKKEDLKKADQLGISDISYSKVKSMIGGFINSLKTEGDNEYKVSEIVLKSKNIEKLAKIVDIIARIPEIKIEMLGQGQLDARSIAILLLGWVSGKKINSIASEIKREQQSLNDATALCNKYLNSQMKSYMPWGINIYQEISHDLDTDNAKLLPSYIYYGVSNKEEVIISKVGVPRFATKNVLQVLKGEYPDVAVNVENMEKIKKLIQGIDHSNYRVENVSGKIIKEIVDSKIK